MTAREFSCGIVGVLIGAALATAIWASLIWTFSAR
jgi:hypothetical protein